MARAWQYGDQDYNGISVGLSEGQLNIAVSDDKAVDSNNSHFTCDINIPMDQAQSLRDWLIRNLPKRPVRVEPEIKDAPSEAPLED